LLSFFDETIELLLAHTGRKHPDGPGYEGKNA
jgi:hypothetical protein